MCPSIEPCGTPHKRGHKIVSEDIKISVRQAGESFDHSSRDTDLVQ